MFSKTVTESSVIGAGSVLRQAPTIESSSAEVGLFRAIVTPHEESNAIAVVCALAGGATDSVSPFDGLGMAECLKVAGVKTVTAAAEAGVQSELLDGLLGFVAGDRLHRVYASTDDAADLPPVIAASLGRLRKMPMRRICP